VNELTVFAEALQNKSALGAAKNGILPFQQFCYVGGFVG
jgi:hypothetical protein